MTQPADAPVQKKGCGPVLVTLISLFCLTLGLLTGAGGLFAFLYFSDSGVEQLGLSEPVPAAVAPTPVADAPVAGDDDEDVYALAFPIQETIQIQGEIDEAAVRNRLTRGRVVFQECYTEELKKSPDTRGEMSLQFTVSGSNGEVIAAVARDNYTGSDSLQRCILNKIREWSFPAPDTSQVSVVRFETLFLPFRADGI